MPLLTDLFQWLGGGGPQAHVGRMTYMLPHNISNGKSELHSRQREKKTRKITELLKDKSVDHW